MLPVRFEKQVAGQLHQLIVLYVQNFQQGTLYPFGQFLQLVMSCTQLPQTVAAEQPAAQRQLQIQKHQQSEQENRWCEDDNTRRKGCYNKLLSPTNEMHYSDTFDT